MNATERDEVVSDAMVEAVARAICASNDENPDGISIAGRPKGRLNWYWYEDEARAAISAMSPLIARNTALEEALKQIAATNGIASSDEMRMLPEADFLVLVLAEIRRTAKRALAAAIRALEVGQSIDTPDKKT